MEVVKGRMQIHQGPKATTLDLIQDIYRTSGIKGFFRGYWMVSTLPFNSNACETNNREY
jgi:hypothetical protein